MSTDVLNNHWNATRTEHKHLCNNFCESGNIMNDFILRGPKSTFLKITDGVGEYFFKQAEKYADRIFQIDGDTEKAETFKVVKNRSVRVAMCLQTTGIRPKDIVLLCCKNNLDNIVPALSALYLGAQVCSVDPQQSVDDVKNCLLVVTPKIVFVEESSVNLIEQSLECCDTLPEMIVIGKSERYLSMLDMEKPIQGEDSFRPVKQSADDIAFIVFSSGTTAVPKGIYISNSYVLNGGLLGVEQQCFKPGVFVYFTSLYWISAIIFTGLCIVTASVRIISPKMTARRFLELIEKYQVTLAFSSNTFTYEITSLGSTIKTFNTSSMYSYCVGGSTMEIQQLKNLRKIFSHTKVSLIYGSTETNINTCFNLVDDDAYNTKLSSSGTVVVDTEIKIVDLDTGKLLGPNQEGEIRIKAPYPMLGYHNHSKDDLCDHKGFFKVGDIGYYDEDKYLYITDRINEMFKYKTYKVSPSLIEHSILRHPSVKEVSVFGIPHPVDRFHPAATVVLKEKKIVSVGELMEWADSVLLEYQKLRGGIIIVDSIPKTPSGKVERRTVRDIYVKKLKDKHSFHLINGLK